MIHNSEPGMTPTMHLKVDGFKSSYSFKEMIRDRGYSVPSSEINLSPRLSRDEAVAFKLETTLERKAPSLSLEYFPAVPDQIPHLSCVGFGLEHQLKVREVMAAGIIASLALSLCCGNHLSSSRSTESNEQLEALI
ncbi:hypothetical protein L3X38_016761 [Prunus dulcis]|uniref:Uncharacterized protein n=1 Tax=Prunus dulcis TaxID=3755 RepID=A0AAD4W5X2_PRUDU|nr:hypothetical protein L3X38_016761 [Prunus dulcis]